MYNLENKISIFKEEKDFLSKEIKASTNYNKYLKLQLEELESKNKARLEESLNNNNNNNNILNSTNSNFDQTIIDNNKSEDFKRRENDKIKLEDYLNRNDEILNIKISREEVKLKEKNKKLKTLESFDNFILQILESKFKEYSLNLKNSKISNQEIFFNSSRNDSVLHSSPVNLIIIILLFIIRKIQEDLHLIKEYSKVIKKK